MKLLLRIKKKKIIHGPLSDQPDSWTGLLRPGCHLRILPSLPSPMAPDLLCPIVQSSHTNSFRSSTSNVFLSSSFRIVAFSSAILFWFLRKSCSLATTKYSYWFFPKHMLGKRILKKHLLLNLSCHHQQIIFTDFYSMEHAGKCVWGGERKHLVWGIL